MRIALVGEWRKVTTTRMWWLLALVMFGYLVFLGAVMAFSLTADTSGMSDGGTQSLSGRDVVKTISTLAVSLGYVFPLVIGALSMTGEYRHRTIVPSLLAEPRRGLVLLAKLVSGLVLGLAYGVVGLLGAVLGGLPFLIADGDAHFLGDGDILRAMAFGVIAVAVWCPIGVGVGSLLTNQVAAVVVILAFTQFVEPILRLGFAAVDALTGLQKFLPGAAAEALAGASLYSTSGMLDLLSRWQGGLVLLGYAAVLALVARLTTLRRDIG